MNGTSNSARPSRAFPARRASRPVRTVLATGTAALLAVTALAACGGDSLEDEGGGGKGSVTIGAAKFTTSKIVANLYAAMLSDAGYDTSIKGLANRELYEPAVERGEIDVVPEYAATMAEFLNAKEHGPKKAAAHPVASNDVASTVAALRKLAEPRGLKVLEAGSAVDQNAFAVSKEFADEHGLKTLSDLGRSGEKIKLAAGDECSQRPFCEPGLEKTYGIEITSIDPKGVGSTQSKQAVKNGQDQMMLTTTTDATLEDFGLVLLKDDKGLQNADNLLPVVNAEDAGDKKIAEALNKVTRTLTTEDLIGLNRQVVSERKKPRDVAESYLADKGLTDG